MENNDDRDNELDRLLKPLKNISPSDLQMQKWQSVLARNQSRDKKIFSLSKIQWMMQLAAAVLVGVLIGAMAFKNDDSANHLAQSMVQISLNDATFERSHDNLD